jgi:membrane-associated protease RseP (regulator of RpoE activity)
MGLLIILLLLSFGLALFTQPTQPPPSPSKLLLVPGINPLIPLGWGLFAIIVALVIHEYGHGLQARAHGMRIRSFGLLLLGPLPLGAFAEPEQHELMRAPRRERQRLFAAGPAVNLYGAFFCFLLIGLVASQFVAADPGLHAAGIVEGAPAEEAGLESFEIITAIDAEPLQNHKQLTAILGRYSANETITLSVLSLPDEQGQRVSREISVTLADRYEWQLGEGTDPESLELYGIQPGDAFLGVSGADSGTSGVDRLAGPLAGDWPAGFVNHALGFMFQPIEILGIPFAYKGQLMHPQEEALLAPADGLLAQTLGVTGLLFILSALFWLTWINIGLGVANLIPLVPFDGGHILRDRMHDWFSFLSRFSKYWHQLRIESVVNRISAMSSLFVLVMVVMLVVLPYLKT